MDCQTVEQNLSLYVDGELDPRTRLSLEVHLRRCALCQAAYKQIQGIRKCLGKTRKKVRAPDDFGAALQTRLRQMESSTLLTSARATTKVRTTVIYTVIGVCLLVATGLFALLVWVFQADPKPEGLARWRPVQSSWTASSPEGASVSFVLARDGVTLTETPVPAPVLAPERLTDRKALVSVSY